MHMMDRFPGINAIFFMIGKIIRLVVKQACFDIPESIVALKADAFNFPGMLLFSIPELQVEALLFLLL